MPQTYKSLQKGMKNSSLILLTSEETASDL